MDASADIDKVERQLAEKVIEGRSSQVADALVSSSDLKGADLKQLAGAQPKGRATDASGPAPAAPGAETPAIDFEVRQGNRETEMAENRVKEEGPGPGGRRVPT